MQTLNEIAQINATIEYPFQFRWGQAARFVGGKYNGFEGTIRWTSETTSSVTVNYENKLSELIEENVWLKDLSEWKSSKSAVEINLKGGA